MGVPDLVDQLEALRSILGPDSVAEREGKPAVSPGTTEEVAAIARYAHANHLAIEIVGAGTKRTWGNPVAPDLLLDTTRLTGVRQHSWQDLTATVAAGTPWAAIQRVLAAHSQVVALDPLWPERATVGGIVATNDSGPLRLRYGSLRDLIIGMTIVLADGTIAHSGGKVVKNVAGYDLHKLMTGAFGTLGVITEVTFRLHPVPKHCQTFTVNAPQAQQLAPLMAAIRDSHLLVEAMQLRGDSDGFHLDIQLNAHPDAHQAALLQSIVVASGIGLGFSPGAQGGRELGFSPCDMPSSMSPDRAPEVFQPAREALFCEGSTVIKLSVLPTDLCEYLDHMQWAPDIEVACVAQSFGPIYAAFSGSPAAIDRYLKSVKSEFLVLTPHGSLERWKANPNSLPLMREIKHQFDPLRILNPGRFLGGI